MEQKQIELHSMRMRSKPSAGPAFDPWTVVVIEPDHATIWQLLTQRPAKCRFSRPTRTTNGSHDGIRRVIPRKVANQAGDEVDRLVMGNVVMNLGRFADHQRSLYQCIRMDRD